MIGWERIQGGKANMKRWVLSFERNVETDNELRVSVTNIIGFRDEIYNIILL